MVKTLITLNLVSTLVMTGVIWIVQIVHYPLFKLVGAENFAQYQQLHSKYITFIVMPLMLIELITASILAVVPPKGMPQEMLWLGLALVLVVWGATFFFSVPQHAILSRGFDVDAHNTLVSTNWIRTIAWTIRTGLVIWLVGEYFGAW
ncbi:MAG: hypothetical protein ACRBF0_07955 [Calditrichia bacterium]